MKKQKKNKKDFAFWSNEFVCGVGNSRYFENHYLTGIEVMFDHCGWNENPIECGKINLLRAKYIVTWNYAGNNAHKKKRRKS